MSNAVFLIEQIATGLYILTAIFAFVALRSWMRASGQYRATYFELERDIARYRRGNALTALILLTEFALIIVGMQRIVAPTLRATTQNTVALNLEVDDGIFATFTPAPIESGIVIDASGVVLGEQNPADLIQPTPTITPTPVGTIIPNAAPANCTNPNVQVAIPANGMVVFEPISVIGTAFVDSFAYYRFELLGSGTSGSFATLERDYTEPVPSQGQLGQFVPAFYRPGWYQFRVAVFDLTNTMRASCTINIYVSEPIPTPTPLGTQTR
ncbi:MAG: hypothetical protein SF162_02185 [bacterium]|nr:hypothetical protein [bacterium]